MDTKKLLVADQKIAELATECFLSKVEGDSRSLSAAEAALCDAVHERRMLIIAEQLPRLEVI
jgi:hypothetical protein